MKRWIVGACSGAVLALVATAAPAAAQHPGRNGAVTYGGENTFDHVPCFDSGQVDPYPYYPGEGSAWSPDGKRFAMVTDPSGDHTAGDLYVLPTAPCAPAARLGAVDPDAQPSFSPDGKQIVVDSGADVVLLDAATGRKVRTLTDEAHPSWSPKGGTIAVEKKGGIYLQDLSTGKATLWRSSASRPDYSPSGTTISYLSGGKIKRAAVAKPGTVTSSGISAVQFTYSPDGSSYLFVTPDGDQGYGTCVIATTSGRITSRPGGDPFCSAPSWQPLP